MKKIYQLICASSLLFGSLMSCDDGSLSHDDVYIPDPVEVTDEDDGYSPEPTTDAVLRIMPDKRHQEIDGFGCSFGWMEAVYGCTQRNGIMDDLYGDNGLRFNIYRGEVMANSLQSDGSYNFKENDNFGYAADSPELKKIFNDPKFKEYAQLWCIDRTSKIRNDIYYFFSVWTPPVKWKVGTGNEEVTGGSGSFNSQYSEEFADYLATFGERIKKRFGINVYGMSGWNEPDQAMGGWDGCMWGNQQMADFTCDHLRKKLDEKGLNNTKVIYGELPWWANAITWVEQSLNYRGDDLENANIVAAGHGYSTVAKNIKPMQAAEDRGIHVWQTETCDDKSRDETWNDAMKWAENYQGYLMNARVNAIVWWAGARYCTSTGENLLQTDQWDFSTSYYRVDRYYSIGQFSRYIPRGSFRTDVEKINGTASTDKMPRELTASAYLKDDDNTYTIVLVNSSKTKAFEAQVEIEGKEFENMVSYTSSSSVKWLRKKLNPSLSGKRTVTVPKYSVVTITGKFREKQ